MTSDLMPTTAAEVAAVAGEMKRVAKAGAGSTYEINQRHRDEQPASEISAVEP
jgi:cobyric acid synthase